ncbi:cardiolipin synthase ClsB [Halomonas sp. TRM85114]|uniref:cardiolipin synthase ClsB n=1 Tax=Halomonas jincaotanensis TaxID=2810616 RepID=UPI001BD48F98|nr:cardiolipin synthase ClsB [Halomonas jincaotanensis]MBS9404603.1 cardiolipin synthase ClsB [Halomonas jincaotanensis]
MFVNFEWREGNQVELLINGCQFFPRVFDSIRSARHEILLETFIIFDDQVGRGLKDALLEAAERQVRIEITVDGYGTADLNSDYIAELRAAGINMHIYDPRPRRFGMRTNLFRRLHRKIVVVDGEVAYIGGINFGADHLPEKDPMGKQDYAVRVRGPIVDDIRAAAETLLLEHQAIQELPALMPAAPEVGEAAILLAVRDNHTHPTDIEEQYLLAIRSATSRLIIANAYFFPSYRIWHELANASRRGVNVILILQGQPDRPWTKNLSSSLYNPLLSVGVRIFEYKERPLHGKIAIADHEWTTVGSSNLDPLSLSLNLEVNLFIRDTKLNREVYEHLVDIMNNSSQEVTPESAAKGPWWRAPLTVVSFHFLRHFPNIVGWRPAHSPKIKPLTVKTSKKKRVLR